MTHWQHDRRIPIEGAIIMYCDDSSKLPILVQALRSTIRSLEESEELRPDDPAMREIKSSILRAIAMRDPAGRESYAAFAEEDETADAEESAA